MNKMIIGLLLVAVPFIAMADSYTWSSGTLSTGTQHETSADIPISGYLDRVIIWNTGNTLATSAVVIASYAGSTAADTIISAEAVGTTPKVVRPRRVGTGSSGTALTHAIGAGSDALTNLATQVLSVPYERVYLGGNTKVQVTLASGTTQTNVTTVQFIFDRANR